MFLTKGVALLASASVAQCANIPKLERVAKRAFTPIEVPFTVERGTSPSDSKSVSPNEILSPLNNTASSSSPGELSSPLQSYFTWYYVTLNVGSNGDAVQLQVDTGSSDTWVIDSSADCSDCETYGTYSPSGSTSAQKLTDYPQFLTQYGDGTTAEGYFYLDTVTLAGITINDTIFADVTEAPRTFGILGIGLVNLETTQFYDPSFLYSNFPQKLVDNGIIPKNAYSLYLNSDNATSGSIIFGGYDSEKIDGSLTTLPITNTIFSAVEFDSFTLPNGDVLDATLTRENYGDPILDSGTSYMTIPLGSDIRTSFLEGLGVTDTTTFAIPCDTTGTVGFNFGGGFTADISLEYFIGSSGDSCYLYFQSEDNYVFGDVILRHLYVLYDLEANTVSLGKVKYTSSSNIVLIT